MMCGAPIPLHSESSMNDEENMTAGDVEGSVRAIGAGVRGEMRAIWRERLLHDAGLLSPRLAEAHAAEAQLARSVTHAGIEHAKHARLGTLIDALG